jgi:hypothetical protein
VVGLDTSEARLKLARAKATLKKLDNVSFQVGSVRATGVRPESFDLVVADLGWHAIIRDDCSHQACAGAARPDATVATLCATRGSFDEFHSVFWEALYRESLLEYSPRIETLSLDRPTVTELENMGKAARLRKVHSVTAKHDFGFDDGSTFVASPLIANYFLPDWLSVIEHESERARVLTAIPGVIDDAREGGNLMSRSKPRSSWASASGFCRIRLRLASHGDYCDVHGSISAQSTGS